MGLIEMFTRTITLQSHAEKVFRGLILPMADAPIFSPRPPCFNYSYLIWQNEWIPPTRQGTVGRPYTTPGMTLVTGGDIFDTLWDRNCYYGRWCDAIEQFVELLSRQSTHWLVIYRRIGQLQARNSVGWTVRTYSTATFLCRIRCHMQISV